MKTILITGATSGIGEATARRFAEQGDCRLILTGRRADRLRDLKAELKAAHDVAVHVMNFDIRDRARVEAALGSLPEPFREIDILINNAGLAAGLDPLQAGDPGDWEAMFDTNVKGLLWSSRIVAAQMVARGGGHIVNLGSIAGTQVYANGNVYCASKHAVHALSQGMRIDLLGTGVRETEICPGLVETEFSVVRFHGDEQRAAGVYEGIEALTGDDVAEAILWAVEQPPHVNIDRITLTPLQQANAYYVKR